jgi:AcrR family transcriptional regulator
MGATMKTGARTGRRRGSSDSRKKILDVAREEFRDHGYDRATMRRIAQGAGCDSALVHHFFGTKEGLFAAAMAVPVEVDRLVGRLAERPRHTVGQDVARLLIEMWEPGPTRIVLLGLLRSSFCHDQAVTMIHDVLVRQTVEPMVRALGCADVELRSDLIAAHILGVAFARHVIESEPLASLSVDDLVRAVAPVMRHYLQDDLQQ